MTKREKTIGIVTGVVLGALLIDRIIYTPLSSRLDVANAQVGSANRDLVKAEALRSNDKRAQQNWSEIAGQTLAADAPTAEGQLLNATRQWAESSGLAISTLRPERNEREQGFQKITIRVTATGTMRQASRFLYAVQSAAIPVRVSDMSLTARKEATDDLAVNIGLSTIYLPAETPRNDSTEVRR